MEYPKLPNPAPKFVLATATTSEVMHAAEASRIDLKRLRVITICGVPAYVETENDVIATALIERVQCLTCKRILRGAQ